MSSWSNEEILMFLEHYQSETSIWNPKDVYHKDKRKVSDGWNRLAELTRKSVKELKSKKEILMATFRKHLKKKQDSYRSGAGAEDIYHPTWFAYNTMEAFLLPVYICNDGINTETQSQQNDMPEEMEEAEDDPLPRDHTDTVTTPSTSSTFTNKRRRPDPETVEQKMALAFGQLTNALGQKQSENRPAHKDDDDCDLYSKLLAIKLRELSNDERKIMMYQIDGLFINRINQNSYARHTPSPQYYSKPSSTPSAYSYRTPSPQFVVIPSRPTSVNTVYSEPYVSNPSSSSEAPSQSINIISDQIVTPATPETNILNMALLNAFEDFQSSTFSNKK